MVWLRGKPVAIEGPQGHMDRCAQYQMDHDTARMPVYQFTYGPFMSSMDRYLRALEDIMELGYWPDPEWFDSEWPSIQ